jgi:hypothetical protein
MLSTMTTAPTTEGLGVGGNRLAWSDLSAHVAAGIEALAGAPVVHAVSQPGGLPAWVVAHVDLLADWESRWERGQHPAHRRPRRAHRLAARVHRGGPGSIRW